MFKDTNYPSRCEIVILRVSTLIMGKESNDQAVGRLPTQKETKTGIEKTEGRVIGTLVFKSLFS